METLQRYFDQLMQSSGIALSDQQKKQLLDYVALLAKWNKAYNLTSIRDPQQMLVRHIMDSLVVTSYLEGEQFIDVGTGPGLPGIPLAIACPARQFTLLDSLGKRIRFIRQVVHELKLTNVTPVQCRVEDFLMQDRFDGVISRAFASLEDMLTWCQHLPKQQTGRFYALKGTISEQEIASIPAAFQMERIVRLNVPNLDSERHLVMILNP